MNYPELEREGDAPLGWEGNVVLTRNTDGTIEELTVADDTEGEEADAGDYQTGK